jgi:ferredoxin-thioredoxin reductase catalytic subunit/rubredoxin
MAEPETRGIDALYDKLEREARAGGYHLNADAEFTRALVEGLVTNVNRYGYQACPCRLAAGERRDDLDIICPCDYRDADLGEFGACYCALYVSREIAEGKAEARAVPERRPTKIKDRPQYRRADVPAAAAAVWRCRVCGYLCGREAPPETCPICKASKDRFEPFTMPAG